MAFAPVVLVLLLGTGLVLLDRLWPANARDVAWVAGTEMVPSDESSVIRRYLARHRRHRMVGGLVGVLAAGTAEVRWHETASIQVLLFGGIAGVLVGTLSAESYRLHLRAAGPSLASLEPRAAAPLPGVVRAARGLLAIAAVVAVALAVWRRDDGPLLLAAAGAAVTAVAEATRAQIVGRRRPVLSARARDLDKRIREFAARSVAWLQLAAAVLVAGGVLSMVPGPPSGPLAMVRGLALVAAFVAAVVCTHRAAPRPPITWRRAP
ncbi:MAG: hypothetical protein B7X41_09190 [Microbacterium sp. 14-71-5]|jgi:hypothetical protein|nr:MAG: hypothetical protein B7X41_09190 [Microbacterium sp. 14-71-5]